MVEQLGVVDTAGIVAAESELVARALEPATAAFVAVHPSLD